MNLDLLHVNMGDETAISATSKNPGIHKVAIL